MAELPTTKNLGARPKPQLSLNVVTPQVGSDGSESEAQSFHQQAGQLDKAGQRLINRGDVIERAQVTTAVTQNLATEMRRLETEEDNSKQETVNKFNEYRNKVMTDAMNGLNGSADGAANIQSDLSRINAKFGDLHSVASIKAGRAMLKDVQDARLNEKLNSVTEMTQNPVLDTDDFEAFYMDLEEFTESIEQDGPAMDDDTKRDTMIAGGQKVVAAAMEGYINAGRLDRVKDLKESLKARGYGGLIDAKVNSAVTKRIATLRAADTKLERDAQKKWDLFEQIYGKGTATKDIKAELALNHNPKDTPYEKAMKFKDAYIKIFKKQPTEDMYMRSMGISLPKEDGPLDLVNAADKKDPEYGYMINQIPALRGRTIKSENLDRLTAYAQKWVSKKIPVFDSDKTTILGYTNRVLPQIVLDAYKEGGYKPPIPQAESNEDPPSGLDDDGDNLNTPPAPKPQTQREAGLFDESENLTGPINSVTPFFRSFPLIGQLMPGSDVVQSQMKMENFAKDLTTALQNNKRFPEGERKQVQKIVNLLPHIIDNTANMRDKMIALDDSLKSRIDFMAEMGEGKSGLSPADVSHMRVMSHMMQNLRTRLNVPQRMSPNDALKAWKNGEMPVGSAWLDNTPGKAYQLHYVRNDPQKGAQ